MSDSKDYDRIGAVSAHASQHESGGSDELDLAGLTPADHAPRHENGGADEIDISGLTGIIVPVGRGDPSSYDFTLGNFTIDDAWHDLDLSSIISAGAILVFMRLSIKNDTNTDVVVKFRKNGNSNGLNTSVINVLLTEKTFVSDIQVLCDSSRIVEYKVDNTGTWSTIDLAVKCWI